MMLLDDSSDDDEDLALFALLLRDKTVVRGSPSLYRRRWDLSILKFVKALHIRIQTKTIRV